MKENDFKLDLLRREKQECKYWLWFGPNGCKMHKTKVCRWCFKYKKKEQET